MEVYLKLFVAYEATTSIGMNTGVKFEVKKKRNKSFY